MEGMLHGGPSASAPLPFGCTPQPAREWANVAPAPPFLVLGVLSAVASSDRRNALRSSWASPALLRQHRVQVRFVLAARFASSSSNVLRIEQSRFDDLLFLQDSIPQVADGDHYGTKAFGWLHVALRLASTPRFIGLADDDAFVDLALVTSDLHLVEKRQLRRVAYGAFEWCAYEVDLGLMHSWGFGERTAALTWLARTSRAPARNDSQSSWSHPFPFVKGPLVAFDLSVARELDTGQHSVRERHRAFAAASRRRVLVDVLFGHILSSDRKGLGVENLTLVNVMVGPKHGFLEIRPGVNASAKNEFPCARVVHFGRSQLVTSAHKPNTVLSACLRTLQRRGPPDKWTRRRLECQRTQPAWTTRTDGVVRVGPSWTMCFLQGCSR